MLFIDSRSETSREPAQVLLFSGVLVVFSLSGELVEFLADTGVLTL